MATVGTSITKIRGSLLQDQASNNYSDAEMYIFYNNAIEYLSQELAKWQHRIGATSTTLTYTAGDYSEALPTGFLALATNEKGEYRVFNASNNYDRVGMAEVSDLDDWEAEDSGDTGTVDEFIIDGANMIVHPRPLASTSIKLYYHPLASITDTSTTMPWSSWFDAAIEQFVVRQCHLRSEMGGILQIDVADYQRLSEQAMAILKLRESTAPLIRFAPGVGW
jgi:hypothetical protein